MFEYFENFSRALLASDLLHHVPPLVGEGCDKNSHQEAEELKRRSTPTAAGRPNSTIGRNSS